MNFRTIVLGASSILISAAPGYAQTQRQPVFNHPLTTFRDLSGSRSGGTSAPETLRILTAMVAFQEDSDPRTTGNGSFDTTAPARNLLDPPPHDSAYVQHHLTFAANYFRKVSDGRLIVTGDVLGPVYRLPYPMQHYSPPRGTTNNLEVGLLMRDSWHLIDSVTPGISFGTYQVFLLVHAGAGRDIDLTSIYGFDPTPFDIPSIYLNLKSLKKMFGDSYQGVPVAGGTFLIPNSIILPETENRILESAVGSSTLQLGINGLLAASVGSHLGLPDLFDTKTGASGIGRFGLMDGQSIFSWSGLFPPEPSAWERAFLGWLRPITVTAGNAVYTLPAVTLPNPEDSVYRVLISAKEYFMVENRNRDANRDGATVTMVRNGQTVVRTWARDTVGFNAFNPDSLYGVVTDVDEFDWSLPGGVSARTGELFDGGILIWHIDENVIEANYDADAVNADPDRRGVNLEEADGSQDIGQSYGLIDPGAGSESGTVLDFWYAGNKAPLRLQSNEFTPTSHPGSLSNDHAESHIYIKEFSARGPRMTARIQVGDEEVRPLAGFPKNMRAAAGISPVVAADLDGDGISELLISTSGKNSSADTGYLPSGDILAWRQNGNSFLPRTDSLGTFVSYPGWFYSPPIVYDFAKNGTVQIATFRYYRRSSLYGQPIIFNTVDIDGDGSADSARSPITSLYAQDVPYYQIAGGKTWVIWAGHGLVTQDSPDMIRLLAGNGKYSGAATFGNENHFILITNDSSVSSVNGAAAPQWEVLLANPLSGSPAVAKLIGGESLEIVVLGKNGQVFVLDSAGNVLRPFPVNVQESISTSPAIADVDGDGKKDIVFTAGERIYALNSAGFPLDYFPIKVPTKNPLVASPVIGDIDGDGVLDILVGTEEGLIFAYNAHGKLLAGFPLQTGGRLVASPTLFKTQSGRAGVAIASDDHFLYAWEMNSPYDSSKTPWPMYLHDAQHTGYEGSAPVPRPLTSEFFPASRAYNWPNPVDRAHGYKTHIRYYVKNPANVHIRIFDLAGDQVTEFDGPGAGGLDNEVDWNVANIQSGIYFARIEAAGSGEGGSAVIKIAVVK